MARPRAADDFAAIRARMEELQRERGQVASNRTEMDTSEPGRSVSAPISQADVLKVLRQRGRLR